MPNLEAYTTITSWIASSTLWNTACTRRSPISIKLALGKSTLSLELTVILESDTTQKKGRKLPSSIVQVLKRGNRRSPIRKWISLQITKGIISIIGQNSMTAFYPANVNGVKWRACPFKCIT